MNLSFTLETSSDKEQPTIDFGTEDTDPNQFSSRLNEDFMVVYASKWGMLCL